MVLLLFAGKTFCSADAHLGKWSQAQEHEEAQEQALAQAKAKIDALKARRAHLAELRSNLTTRDTSQPTREPEAKPHELLSFSEESTFATHSAAYSRTSFALDIAAAPPGTDSKRNADSGMEAYFDLMAEVYGVPRLGSGHANVSRGVSEYFDHHCHCHCHCHRDTIFQRGHHHSQLPFVLASNDQRCQRLNRSFVIRRTMPAI